ncbi:hypothetical protein PMAYCL1PPCAC_13212, partial [Pristionchus mayeri]
LSCGRSFPVQLRVRERVVCACYVRAAVQQHPCSPQQVSSEPGVWVLVQLVSKRRSPFLYSFVALMASTSGRCDSSEEEERSVGMSECSKRSRRRRGRRTRKKSERDSPASEFNRSPATPPLECRKRCDPHKHISLGVFAVSLAVLSFPSPSVYLRQTIGKRGHMVVSSEVSTTRFETQTHSPSLSLSIWPDTRVEWFGHLSAPSLFMRLSYICLVWTKDISESRQMDTVRRCVVVRGGCTVGLTPSSCRTLSVGAPPAPRNTNDFLIEDMEKREEDGAKRLRREDIESNGQREEAEDGLTGEDEFEDQYEESWQECVVDKYKEMNHDELARRMAVMEKNRDEVERKLLWERSKSDYLQERLLEAEEQIRGQDCPIAGNGSGSGSDSPPPPVPSVPHSSYALPSGMLLGGPNCSPNVISSPRA